MASAVSMLSDGRAVPTSVGGPLRNMLSPAELPRRESELRAVASSCAKILSVLEPSMEVLRREAASRTRRRRLRSSSVDTIVGDTHGVGDSTCGVASPSSERRTRSAEVWLPLSSPRLTRELISADAPRP